MARVALVVAGLIVLAGILVAVLLPHHCRPVMGPCPLFGCDICTGAGVWPRLLIVAGALLIGGVMVMVSRRTPPGLDVAA
jgi:hypothetical protein